MMMLKLLAAAAAVGGMAAPVAAQVPYTYPQAYPPTAYPQAYPGTGYSGEYGYPGPYSYAGQYGSASQGTGTVAQIIDSLLGHRYSLPDRTAVSQCANAAMVQAQAQYRGYGYGQQGYGYGQAIAAPAMRITAITDVQRRNSGLRVKGLMSSGYAGYNGYQSGYGYQNQGYANGDLTFRCNVDYRGAVTNVRISANNSAYRRY